MTWVEGGSEVEIRWTLKQSNGQAKSKKLGLMKYVSCQTKS